MAEHNREMTVAPRSDIFSTALLNLDLGTKAFFTLSPITALAYMGSCQNYGPFLGTVNIRCRNIIRTQKRPIILRTTHILSSNFAPRISSSSRSTRCSLSTLPRLLFGDAGFRV